MDIVKKNNSEYLVPARKSYDRISLKLINQMVELLEQKNRLSNVIKLVHLNKNTYYKWIKIGKEIEAEIEANLPEDGFDLDLRENRKRMMEILHRDPRDLLYYELYIRTAAAQAEAEASVVRVINQGIDNGDYEHALKAYGVLFGSKEKMAPQEAEEAEDKTNVSSMTDQELLNKLAQVIARNNRKLDNVTDG